MIKCTVMMKHDVDCGDIYKNISRLNLSLIFCFLEYLCSGSDTNYVDVQNDDWGSSQAEGKSLNIISISE